MNELKQFEEEQKGNRNKMLYKWYKKQMIVQNLKQYIFFVMPLRTE